MNTITSLTRLQESLLQLAAFKNSLEAALRALAPADRVQDEDLKFTVSNHIQVLLCSFLEEWKVFEGLGADSNVRNTLRVAAPAVDRVRRWRGLPKVRSMLLAHGFRGKDGKMVHPWDVFAKHDAPTAYAEVTLLANCAKLAIEAALDRHRQEYKEAAEHVLKMNRDIEDKGIRTIGEIKAELSKIDEEMAKLRSAV